MQKYGPPRRIDKMDGHEFWTYVLDLGVQSNTFGTLVLSGSAAGFSPAPGTAQAFGYTSGFGSSSSFSQPVRDEFTYEIDKSGIVERIGFGSRRPDGSTAYSSRRGYVTRNPRDRMNTRKFDFQLAIKRWTVVHGGIVFTARAYRF